MYVGRYSIQYTHMYRVKRGYWALVFARAFRALSVYICIHAGNVYTSGIRQLLFLSWLHFDRKASQLILPGKSLVKRCAWPKFMRQLSTSARQNYINPLTPLTPFYLLAELSDDAEGTQFHLRHSRLTPESGAKDGQRVFRLLRAETDRGIFERTWRTA